MRWCWLQLAGAALMLQQFATEGHDSWVPTSKVGEGVTICFMCNDAIEVFEGARTRDLAPPRPVVSNGLWITSFSDPDGYRLDFESPTDAAEESVYES